MTVSTHQGRTYIVTGAASGIGAETMRLLRAEGAAIVAVDRNPVEGADAFFAADLADPGSIDRLIDALPQGTDGLANIAGVPPTLPAEQVLKVNWLGLRRLTVGVARKLGAGASIVNLGSLAGAGWRANRAAIVAALALDFDQDVEAFCRAARLDEGGASYALSKQALIVWTMKNRWTWRDRNIRINVVSPGPVVTPIYPQFQRSLGARAEEDARIMDRPAVPADIAPVLSFLLSAGSGWIRGADIAVDGGMAAFLHCKALAEG